MSPTFAELGVPADLVAVLDRQGATEPFAIQATSLVDLLAGRDVCGRAPTGSGKTLAFSIPLAARVGKGRSRRPRALVLAPTRELAEQIHRQLQPLLATRGRRAVSVYGGVGYGGQRSALRKGVDVVVACPGRLEDLIASGDVVLDEVEIVVIDEADRMADMGFLPSVRRLLDATAEDRQTVLFSATLDGDVAVLTERYQDRPVSHEVGEVEPDVTAAEHQFWPVAHEEKRHRAAELVTTAGPTVIFCRTRRGADRLTLQLGRAGVEAAAIHGGRSQGQRDRALASFARGRVQALVATDVAARGIHVDGVACVLHYDPPEDDKAYLHRSGRTARAGARGLVVSLIRPDEVGESKARRKRLGLPADAHRGPTATATAPDAAARTPDKRRVQAAATSPAQATGHADRPPRRRTEQARRGRKSAGDTGTVKFFDTRRGYGFIAVTGRDDLFVHHSHVGGSGGVLDKGQRVSFVIAQGRRGDEARDVRVV